MFSEGRLLGMEGRVDGCVEGRCVGMDGRVAGWVDGLVAGWRSTVAPLSRHCPPSEANYLFGTF